jgi:hypothetical protein
MLHHDNHAYTRAKKLGYAKLLFHVTVRYAMYGCILYTSAASFAKDIYRSRDEARKKFRGG